MQLPKISHTAYQAIAATLGACSLAAAIIYASAPVPGVTGDPSVAAARDIRSLVAGAACFAPLLFAVALWGVSVLHGIAQSLDELNDRRP